MQEKPETVTITKRDAINRQITTAIWLWFHDGDPVSIHSLAAAGLKVLHDIGKKRGMPSRTYSDEMRKLLGKSKITDIETFFKHANTDPNSVLEFPPIISEYFLTDATQLYMKMFESSTRTMDTYAVWFMVHRRKEVIPDDITDFMDDAPFAGEVGRLAALSKRAFFEKIMGHYSRADAASGGR